MLTYVRDLRCFISYQSFPHSQRKKYGVCVCVCVCVCVQLGVNAEHSWADAPIIGYMMEYCSNMELEIGYDNGHCWNYDKAVAPVCPQRLDWDLQACVTEINSAQKFAEEQIADLDLYVMRHDAFGKGVIKTCGISPDAFIQMALQMAYYKVGGENGCG